MSRVQLSGSRGGGTSWGMQKWPLQVCNEKVRCATLPLRAGPISSDGKKKSFACHCESVRGVCVCVCVSVCE